ncbi:MAG: hypothetical protein KDA99_30940 [Planctomycetales bacterium]|nr:hypothetical protein [Planctomycetales bacterium]
MNWEAIIAAVVATITIGGSVLLGAFKIGRHVRGVNDKLDSVEKCIVELKAEVSDDLNRVENRIVSLESSHREEQQRQWEVLHEHEKRIDSQGETLAKIALAKITQAQDGGT